MSLDSLVSIASRGFDSFWRKIAGKTAIGKFLKWDFPCKIYIYVAARFFLESASNFLLFKNEALSRTETNLIETNNYPTLRLAETDKIYQEKTFLTFSHFPAFNLPSSVTRLSFFKKVFVSIFLTKVSWPLNGLFRKTSLLKQKLQCLIFGQVLTKLFNSLSGYTAPLPRRITY